MIKSLNEWIRTGNKEEDSKHEKREAELKAAELKSKQDHEEFKKRVQGKMKKYSSNGKSRKDDDHSAAGYIVSRSVNEHLINELSTKLLKRYFKKAGQTADGLAAAGRPLTPKERITFKKRVRGEHMAEKKIKKSINVKVKAS